MTAVSIAELFESVTLIMVLVIAFRPQHRSILGAAGHITMTPANQLMVIELKIWSLSNPCFEPATFLLLARGAYQLSH
jgi:hypothetical protein